MSIWHSFTLALTSILSRPAEMPGTAYGETSTAYDTLVTETGLLSINFNDTWYTPGTQGAIFMSPLDRGSDP